jgi:hypothetical protein
MLALSLILIGILLRFAPHAPNFTPVAAIALFSAVYLDRKYALIIPLLLMVISDLFLGMHNVMFFTWGGFILITFLGFWLKKNKNMGRIVVTSLASALLFFIVSNFGVWVMGWYPHTLKGLVNCYIMALPFLRNFTLATFCFVALFFGVYELIARRVKDTKLAKVFLTI